MADESIPIQSDDPRKAAIERLRNRRSFVQDVVSYIVINAFLVLIWMLSGRGYFWPAWVMGGWGIGVLLHGWTVFFQRPITEADIEQEIRRGGHLA